MASPKTRNQGQNPDSLASIYNSEQHRNENEYLDGDIKHLEITTGSGLNGNFFLTQ